MSKVKIIDLFAGIGGIRKGFELAFREEGIETECVFTSEIKEHAKIVLSKNYNNEKIHGDITQIDTTEIPDFDFLLGGFPCQSFSNAGKRLGFLDTRGTLFFDIERIIKAKKPYGFILENVEGLVTHDRENPKDDIGKTLSIILAKLDKLGYKVSWKVLNSKNFGVPQERKRIYIVGTKKAYISLDKFEKKHIFIESILECGLPTNESKLSKLLLQHYTPTELLGKSIKDKRGGKSNIHSWDIELKGSVSAEQKELLNLIFKERRKKVWAEELGIVWMDGMPLTEKQIFSFYPHKNLNALLTDLKEKGYLKLEHPKDIVEEPTENGIKRSRAQKTSLPKGYNIVAGKLSFEINKILHPKGIAPTLVAMDMKKIFVVDNDKLRTLSLREGLRLFGYPEDYEMPVELNQGYDLLGNTVVVPVIKSISERLAKQYLSCRNI